MTPRPVFSLSVDRHTPVLVQGITGRTGQRHARMMRDAGTAIVGGVSARADIGPVDGIPVFADCSAAVAATGAVASVLLVGEIGGNEEEEFAQAIATSQLDKPVVALIAGRTAPGGVSMGHAGALTWGSFGTREAKRAALAGAGVQVCATIDEAVQALARALGKTPE